MGIMNKMKTVAINQMTWGYWEPTKKFYANIVGPEAVPNTLNLACDGYMAQRGGTSGTSLIDKGIGIHNNGLSIYLRNDSFNGDTSAFLASEGDKTITYETIDSVEEKIVNPNIREVERQWTATSWNDTPYDNTQPCIITLLERTVIQAGTAAPDSGKIAFYTDKYDTELRVGQTATIPVIAGSSRSLRLYANGFNNAGSQGYTVRARFTIKQNDYTEEII